MKKYLIFLLAIFLNQPVFADFVNSKVDYTFDRKNAITYMQNYWQNYNSLYFNFNEIGGDCTNYASQIMHNSGVFFTPTSNTPDYRHWYYYSSEWGYGRSSTWTSATEFRKYFGDVLGDGSKVSKEMETYTVNEAILSFNDIWRNILPGDIISHGHDEASSYHTQIVYGFDGKYKDILVSQHSSNQLNRSLFDYLMYRQRIGQGDEFVFIIFM